MKKAILPLIVLTSVLASCGQQSPMIDKEGISQPLTDDVSKLKAENGWKEVVPGGYLRVTENGRQIVAVTLEGFKWALQEEQAIQEREVGSLSLNSKKEGSRDKAISFLKEAISQWDTKLTAQKTATIYPCTVSASAMGGASTAAAKAYASTSCSESRQQSSNTTVSTSKGNSYGNDQNNNYRFSSKASAYLDGPGPCSAFASAGIVNQGYISDSYNQCYGSNGN